MYNKEETINEIVKEAKKLDKMELQILLTRLRAKKLQREERTSIIKLKTGTALPTLEDIDLWKHQSRK